MEPVRLDDPRYKDTCKSALKCGGVIKEWKGGVNERKEWRQVA